ncbi:MAG: STAS domain-containing protein [Candidatus Baltobacteraceae bacterium]
MFTVPSAFSDEAFDRLLGQVADAIERGAKEIVLALDAVAVLDSAAIRRLIKLLRRIREAGADLTLAVSRMDLLRTLEVTALDKVFRLVATAESAA